MAWQDCGIYCNGDTSVLHEPIDMCSNVMQHNVETFSLLLYWSFERGIHRSVDSPHKRSVMRGFDVFRNECRLENGSHACLRWDVHKERPTMVVIFHPSWLATHGWSVGRRDNYYGQMGKLRAINYRPGMGGQLLSQQCLVSIGKLIKLSCYRLKSHANTGHFRHMFQVKSSFLRNVPSKVILFVSQKIWIGITRLSIETVLPRWCVTRLNTLRPRQNGRHFPDDTFKHIFVNENCCILMKISLRFVPHGPINNILALVQIMAWRRSGDKPLSGPMVD